MTSQTHNLTDGNIHRQNKPAHNEGKLENRRVVNVSKKRPEFWHSKKCISLIGIAALVFLVTAVITASSLFIPSHDLPPTFTNLINHISTEGLKALFGLSLCIASVATVTFLVKAIQRYLVNQSDRKGKFPIDHTISSDMQNTKALEQKLKQGANPNKSSIYGSTPIKHAIDAKIENLEIKTTVFELLLQYGADPNEMFWKFIKHHVNNQEIDTQTNSLVKLFKAHGADIDLLDQYGNTPLLCAVNEGCANLAQILIENGADPAKGDRYNRSPFDIALSNKNEAIATMLINKACDFPLKNSEGTSYISLAIDNGLPRIASILDKKSRDLASEI